MEESKVFSHFFFRLKKYIIKYSKGALVIPVVSNSPRVMIESALNVPTFKKGVNTIHGGTFIARGLLHYYEHEKGFWNIVSSTYHKKNVIYDIIYDPTIPSNYYALNFCLVNKRNNDSGKLYSFDGIEVPEYSWLLIKPKNNIKNSYPKGNTVINFALYFSEDWFNKNIITSALNLSDDMKNFLSSDSTYHLFKSENQELTDLTRSITKEIIEQNGSITKKIDLKIASLKITQLFFERNNIRESVDKINLENRVPHPQDEMIRILNEIHSNLYKSFPGLDEIAKEVGISSRTLISKFKKQHGISVFQYFRKKQLALSKTIIEKDKRLIKDVARDFGYSNVSKFSAAFKKEFGYLPKDLKE